MGQKLTREFKVKYCGRCGNADKKALKAGEGYCKKEYKLRNGLCLNFITPKR